MIGIHHLPREIVSCTDCWVEHWKRVLPIACYESTTPNWSNRSGFGMKNDGAWRGEFWGKIVRSAILAYCGNGDQELLKTIRCTVADMLSTQTDDGCISTSSTNAQ